MRWPLVARSTLDAVEADRNHWQQQYNVLLLHTLRMDRVHAGLPEVAPVARKAIEPMPDDLSEYTRRPSNPLHRKRLAQSMLGARQQLGSWDAVRESLPDFIEEET